MKTIYRPTPAMGCDVIDRWEVESMDKPATVYFKSGVKLRSVFTHADLERSLEIEHVTRERIE